MRSATLRTVGGSTVVAIPPAMLDQLGLTTNDRVTLAVEGGRIVINRQARQKYALADLLAQCDFDAQPSNDETEWMTNKPIGLEDV
jgi:antitoxin ChpS